MAQMRGTSEQRHLPVEQEQLGLGGFLHAALYGIGVMLGLGYSGPSKEFAMYTSGFSIG